MALSSLRLLNVNALIREIDVLPTDPEYFTMAYSGVQSDDYEHPDVWIMVSSSSDHEGLLVH